MKDESTIQQEDGTILRDGLLYCPDERNCGCGLPQLPFKNLDIFKFKERVMIVSPNDYEKIKSYYDCTVGRKI